MTLPIIEIVFLLLLGFAVSIVANTLGIEGGIIFIPVFVLGLGLTAQEAAGVSLTTMIFGLGSGSLAYALQKRIDYKLSLLLGSATIPGAILGAWTTQFVSSNVLKLLFGLTLIPLAIRMVMENRGALESVKEHGQGKWKRRLIDRDGKDFTYSVNHPLLGVGAYFFIGFISGLFGIGGGALRIPVLVLLLGFPMHIAIATSVFTMVISSVAGATAHFDLGHVKVEYVVWLVPAVICGAQIGARLARRTKAQVLKKIFASILITVGVIIIAESLLA